MTFVPPFSPPAVIAGQGTVGLEIVEQVPDVDTLLVAIGGGELIAGVANAIKALRPGVRIVGIEPEGAPTHHASRAARSEENTSEIQSLMRTSYTVFCLKKKKY